MTANAEYQKDSEVNTENVQPQAAATVAYEKASDAAV